MKPTAGSMWLSFRSRPAPSATAAAELAAKSTPDGSTLFFGTTGALGKYEPRIYFGESSPEYSVVGGNKQEFDYPDPNGTGQISYTYSGTGGVQLELRRWDERASRA